MTAKKKATSIEKTAVEKIAAEKTAVVLSDEEARRANAGALLAERKLDALLVSSLHNIRYLTGFTGSNAALLLQADGRATLFTDPRYTVQAGQQATCRVKIAKGPLTKAVLEEMARAKVRQVGVEADHLTFAQYEALAKGVPGRTELKAQAQLIERLRMVKDGGEIAKIRASVQCNSAALEAALGRFRAGMTEAALAAEIDHQSRKRGAEAPAFDTIVAAGARAALPHAHPGATKIGPGILLIDMGAFRDGYASDMTRTLHVGKATAKFRSVYKAVLEAEMAAIDAVRAGVTAASVDAAARKVLRGHGLEKQFIHSTGHGLGLEIHEPPRLGRRDKTRLEAGMAITVEPGVYVEGWGGIRIEDTILVTYAGCEVLTPTPKELREL